MVQNVNGGNDSGDGNSDKDNGNGLFLASHDPSMQAKIYKTVESVPEILNNTVF